MNRLIIAFGLTFCLLHAQGPDAGGYRWIDSDSAAGPEFNWVDITGTGTSIQLGDDDNQGPFALKFPFVFYDTTYDSVRICSNGWLSFISSSHQFHHYSFPDPRIPNAVLAPLWADLDPSAGGAVYYLADSAQDRFIVSWVGVPFHGTGETCTFQAIIDTSGTIVFQYLEVGAGVALGVDSCSVGIEDGDGAIGLEYLCDSEPVENLVHDSLAVRFYRLDYDVCPTGIARPFDRELAGDTVLPMVTVWNPGKASASFPVTLRIGAGYEEQVAVVGLAPLGDTMLEFPAWIPGEDSYQVELFTTLPGDEFPANDTIHGQTAASFTGDIRYDDGAADTWFLRMGSPNVDWAAAVRFTPPYSEYRLLGLKIFVLDTQPFQRVLVCPDSGGEPNLERPFVEAESVAATQPEAWLELGADTLMSSRDDLWLVAFWPRAADGPMIGDDRTPVIEQRSYFGSTTVGWIPHRDGDLVARLRIEGLTGIAELRPVGKMRLDLSPNPFRANLAVRLAGCTGDVTGRVCDAAGRVKREFAVRVSGRSATWVWDGTDANGRAVPAGAYFVEVRAGGTVGLAKVLLTR